MGCLDWYCRPIVDGVWSRSVDNALGAYTPCAINTLVVGISQVLLFCLCSYRLCLLTTSTTHVLIARYRLRRPHYNYCLALLAAYFVVEHLFELYMGISVSNLDGQTGFAPFEVVSIVIGALVWCCILTLLLVETKVYVREFRWYVRFGMIYLLVGEAVLFTAVVSLKDYYSWFVLHLYYSEIVLQVLFGILLLVHIPDLDPFPGYISVSAEASVEKIEYQTLPGGGEQICPEMHVNIFSKIFFCWMSPLMQKGYRTPLTEADVWNLDPSERSENLIIRFHKSWAEESQRSKPWLLRALNQSLGGRFWLAGFFKIGNDLSLFVGPVILNLLLESMQREDPPWIGYVYAFSIFVGVSLGVLSEAQYFQNAMRVGFQLRATLPAS